ncbi:alpha/beta-hydrolase [Xylona heveae TC161]|uniref:Alpha/beta-hydrolase n=1 Tax=Xylona heveae (strain CBS 132557 / TC161) TaxID=1328760 RepID=A0A165GB08_XYLHT|nr:alpha/beta-hydrolase [Xylona heveae TC161]KZF21967.1 alpha/beta-hydrolase [Xylona heveae TC161]
MDFQANVYGNPSLIQASKNFSSLPLYLIHDGGGTIYAYHLLPDLGRTLYGIHNPKFESGNQWKGGLLEMAQTYARDIEKTKPQNGIILGGWSLGGILAIEVARKLAGRVAVAGVIMIDSPCPNIMAPAQEPKVPFQRSCPPRLRERVQKCIGDSLRMVQRHTAPTKRADWSVAPGLSGPAGHGNSEEPPRLPYIVLLRAIGKLPEEINKTDTGRELPLLGWETGELELIKKVLDVPGHHFNMFEDHPDKLAAQLKEACAIIETNHSS